MACDARLAGRCQVPVARHCTYAGVRVVADNIRPSGLSKYRPSCGVGQHDQSCRIVCVYTTHHLGRKTLVCRRVGQTFIVCYIRTYDFDHSRLASVKNSASRDTLDAMADTEQVDRWSDLRYTFTAISDGGMRRHGTTRCHTIRVRAVRSQCTRGSHVIQRRYEGYARHVHVHVRERCITRYDNILVGGGIGGKRGHE